MTTSPERSDFDTVLTKPVSSTRMPVELLSSRQKAVYHVTSTGSIIHPPIFGWAIVESSQGRIGTLADRVLLLCYHYDPLTGKYGLAISRALWVGGLLTVMGTLDLSRDHVSA